MILNEEQLTNNESRHRSDCLIQCSLTDLFDTIADLKRQLRERPRHYLDFLSILEDYQKMPRKEFDATHGDDISAALDAYVQEKVGQALSDQHHGACNHRHQAIGGPGCICEVICRGEIQKAEAQAVLAESEAWNSIRILASNFPQQARAEAEARLAANRAKVKL